MFTTFVYNHQRMLKSFQITQNRKGPRLHTTSCNRSQIVKTMENDDGNMFMGNRGPTGNNNNNNLGWDILELNPTTTRSDWGSNNETNSLNFYTSDSGRTETTSSSSEANALMFLPNQHSLYTGDGSHMNPPDPHLVCLKLGKRHYFEDITDLTDSNMFINGKKGKPLYNNINNISGEVGASSSTASMAVPRCQVEGCNVALVNAKDYHRRHKVCEMHSKTPKVVVLGLEQRFCQQCSRFHVVSEFDESKRSCRRRLAGHNERRRKLSHDSASRTSAQGPALSLLSSKTDSWIPPSDVSTRSSAALHDLIAEYRAAILARQLDCHLHHHAMEDLGDLQQGSSSTAVQHHSSLPCFPDQTSAQVTLDLMQASSSAFGMLSVRGKTKEDVEECSELWNSLQGTHG